jgi:hypothetical protein
MGCMELETISNGKSCENIVVQVEKLNYFSTWNCLQFTDLDFAIDKWFAAKGPIDRVVTEPSILAGNQVFWSAGRHVDSTIGSESYGTRVMIEHD